MRKKLLASTGMALLAASLPAPESGAAFLDEAVVERLRPVVPAAVELYNTESPDPLPAPTREQIENLLAGEVVRVRRRIDRGQEDPPERVTGYRIVPLPRSQVWVSALDPEFQATDLLTEYRLPRSEGGKILWHQYLSLPWPVADRQWVIEVGVRTMLAAATDDLIWEQTWHLADSGERIAQESIAAGHLAGITQEAAENAIYVPANEGSWILFQLEANVTLVAYRVIARVGGRIPDSWIAGFGMAQLSQVLDAVAEHAVEAPVFYDPDHQPILGGDGEPIGRF